MKPIKKFDFFKRTYLVIILLSLFNLNLYSQQAKKHSIFKDSIDNKFDFSDFLIQYPQGFIPIIQPITEPSLGYFGLALTPVFLKPNKHPYPDRYTPPNITAVFAGYTLNSSWGAGILHMGTLTKQEMKYLLGGGYGSVNLDFYRTLPLTGERSFSFNFKSSFFAGNLLKQIGHSNISIGIEYLLLYSEITPRFTYTVLPDFIKEKDFRSILSSPGILAQFDTRDNIFTPNKGCFIDADYRINADFTGSDYEFQNFEFTVLQYFQSTKKLISGFKFDMILQNGDAPFYAKPSIALRGVPAARYQGNSTYLVETEQRYDFILRWSGVLFGGLAKAIDNDELFTNAQLVYNYGTGFRYLIARKFQIRTGIDVAWSNQDFGYYIVFGSAWNNRN